MHQPDRSESSTSRAPDALNDELFSSPTRPHHAVQFYENEEVLCHAVVHLVKPVDLDTVTALLEARTG